MKRFFGGSVEPLGHLDVLICASTEQLARDNCVLVQAGLDLSNYRRNPIVLFQHQQDSPVGTATAIGFDDDKQLVARVTFAPIGISQVADQVRALVKSGVLRGVSIGFDPKETEPLDPKKPRGAQRITKSELLEISFVSVPADTGAGVTARFSTRADMLATMNRLPAIPVAAVQRAAAGIAGARRGPIVNPTIQTYLLLEANKQRDAEREKRFSREQRQADLRELGSKNGGNISTH